MFKPWVHSAALALLWVPWTHLVGAEPPQTAAAARTTGVTYQRLVQAPAEPTNWLTYSGQYSSQRFSRLDQINDHNVQDLRLKWVRQFKTLEAIETSPLVVDGILYATLPRNELLALDAKTGLRYWVYQHRLPDQLNLCCGQVNRGVGMLGETLYLGTLDAQLVALDSKSGNVRWKVQVADHQKGYSITSAPLVVKDLVITGIAAANSASAAFWTPTTPKRASGAGAPIRSRAPVKEAMRLGPATPGKPDRKSVV